MHLYICRLFAILASLLATQGLAKGTGLDPAPCRIDAEASIIVLRDCTTESRRDGALLRNFIHLQWEGTRPSQHVLGLGMPHPKVAQVRQSGPDEARPAVSDSIDASVLLNIEPDTPAAQRPPPGLQLGVPLQLHPGLNRIEVLAQPLGTPIRLPEARLYTDAAWQNWNSERTFQSGALLGVLMMLLAALGLAYALGREPSYPPYAALTLSYVLGILHLSGHLQPAFWQHAPELNLRILPWISLSVALSHGAFAITFLRLRERQRWAYRSLITVMVLLTLSHVAIPQHLLVSLTLFGIGEALIAVIAVSAVATRLPGALWYAAGSAAFAVFAIGLFGVSCLGFNPWPAVYLMDYFRIGCLLEIICFCGAQVLRVLDLRRQSAELRKRQVDDARALIDAMQALNSAHEQATSNRLMLATTSHDLAQPLSALRMTVQALQSQATPHPDHFKQIDANLQYVQSMLHSVLDKARAEQHQTRQAELVVLGELFADVAHRHLASAHAKGLRLTWLDSTREVRAPALVLQRMLDNLVSNAVRYTLRGRVVLGARWRQDVLELQVLDTGPGLTARQQRSLPQPFQQGDAQAAQGHGMGLHIVRTLSAECGYRLIVRSNPGRGSCFAIELPLQAG